MTRALRHWAVCITLCCWGAAYGLDTETVGRYCSHLAEWASSNQMASLYALEGLRSESPSFRIGDSMMAMLAEKNNLAPTDTYEWDVFIPCLQKEIDRGIKFSFSDLAAVPEEYIETKYPGVGYVACRVEATGSLNYDRKELFILKGDKIVKITDYVEIADETTGQKKIEVDYLDLAEAAFADRDYAKCYALYKEGGLKSMEKKVKDGRYESWTPVRQYIFPYIESSIALGKWDDAMHGITDHHLVTNRKTWVNGAEWKLNPEDIRSWNPEKAPLMDYLLTLFFKYYSDKATRLQDSPAVRHAARCSGRTVEDITREAALYFWRDRRNWLNERPLKAAAELGYLEAQRQLGKYYMTGQDIDPASRNTEKIRPDTLKAVEWFEKAALQGDIESANIAAHHYLAADGVPRNSEKAFRLYSLGEDSGDFDALYGMGLCLYYGLGTERNPRKALEYLEQVAEWHPDVPYLIARIYYEEGCDPRAVKYLESVLKRNGVGNAVKAAALTLLADCTLNGKCGLQADPAEAQRLLEEARKYGNYDEDDAKAQLVALSRVSIK